MSKIDAIITAMRLESCLKNKINMLSEEVCKTALMLEDEYGVFMAENPYYLSDAFIDVMCRTLYRDGSNPGYYTRAADWAIREWFQLVAKKEAETYKKYEECYGKPLHIVPDQRTLTMSAWTFLYNSLTLCKDVVNYNLYEVAERCAKKYLIINGSVWYKYCRARSAYSA